MNDTSTMPLSAAKLKERERKLKKLINLSVIKKYVNAMKPTTRAVEEFHLVTILHIVSSMLMRKVYFQQGTSRYFPNLYTLIVAPSSRAKKSTATDNYKYWIKRLGLGRYLIGNIVTIEGLGAYMADVGDEVFPKQKGVAFAHYDEFSTLLSMCKGKKYSAGLLNDLNELYGCNELQKTFKTTPIKIEETYTTIIGATHKHGIEDFTDEYSLLSGFFPRFLICYETHINEHISDRPEPDHELFLEVQNRLDAIKEFIGDIGTNDSKKYYLSPEAKAIFDPWSHANDAKSENEVFAVATMMGRSDTLFFKIALILHFIAGRFNDDHISAAIAKYAMIIVDWHIENYRNLIVGNGENGGLAFSESKRKLNDTIDMLKARKKVTYSDIVKQKGWSKREILEITQALWEDYIIDKKLGPRSGEIYTYIEECDREAKMQSEIRIGEEQQQDEEDED